MMRCFSIGRSELVVRVDVCLNFVTGYVDRKTGVLVMGVRADGGTWRRGGGTRCACGF